MKAVTISVLLWACGVAAFAADAPKAETVLKSYKTELVKITTKPHAVNVGIFMLCKRVEPAELKEMSEAEYGPHFMTNIDVFVDKSGEAALKAGKNDLPIGTVIVKEKSKSRYGKFEGAEGVGGMIKREEGYDLKNGNWEYFYSDKDGKVTSGKMENCIKCHQKAAETDYVFRSWLKPILEKETEIPKKQ